MNTVLVIHWMLWFLAAIGAFAVASTIAFQSWQRFAQTALGPPSSARQQGGPKTALDQVLDTVEAPHPGLSGVRCLFDNSDAFAVRAKSLRLAGRSIDVMTYIWLTDDSGWLLLRDVLAAADRGARVRLLLDDLSVQGFDPVFLALSQHKNIEVRLFNPIRSRGNVLQRILETVLGLSRYNRRLHCKAWIVDGRLAIVGGRNIADTYFGRPSRRPSGMALPKLRPRISRDADLMLCGPCVTPIEAVFDSYWDLSLVLPIKALLPRLKIGLKWFRRHVERRCSSADAVRFSSTIFGGHGPMSGRIWNFHWTDKVRVLADPPEKALGVKKSPWMHEQVRDLLAAAQSDVSMITPYFVPGSAGLADLEAVSRRGVAVSILTNALAACDNIVVHGAYSFYRAPLLAAGVRLFEFAPPRVRGLARDVLHSKVFIIDKAQVLVGSLNFDMRSAYTNAELGVLVDHPELAIEALAAFDRDSGPDQAYALTYENGSILWQITRPGLPSRLGIEPESSWPKRFVSWAVGHLPIHGWL